MGGRGPCNVVSLDDTDVWSLVAERLGNHASYPSLVHLSSQTVCARALAAMGTVNSGMYGVLVHCLCAKMRKFSRLRPTCAEIARRTTPGSISQLVFAYTREFVFDTEELARSHDRFDYFARLFPGWTFCIEGIEHLLLQWQRALGLPRCHVRSGRDIAPKFYPHRPERHDECAYVENCHKALAKKSALLEALPSCSFDAAFEPGTHEYAIGHRSYRTGDDRFVHLMHYQTNFLPTDVPHRTWETSLLMRLLDAGLSSLEDWRSLMGKLGRAHVVYVCIDPQFQATGLASRGVKLKDGNVCAIFM